MTAPTISPRRARVLRQHTSAISDADRLWSTRAKLMSDLWAEGHSLEAIAEAAGITREAARKSILRWRKRTGWTEE